LDMASFDATDLTNLAADACSALSISLQISDTGFFSASALSHVLRVDAGIPSD